MGLKVVLYYFFSVSMLMILVGFSILAIDAVQEKEEALGPFGQPQRVKPSSEFNEAQRIAVALILTGLLFGLFHWVLAKIVTNDRQYPAWPVVSSSAGDWPFTVWSCSMWRPR